MPPTLNAERAITTDIGSIIGVHLADSSTVVTAVVQIEVDGINVMDTN